MPWFVDMLLWFEALTPPVKAGLIQVCGTVVAATAALIGVAATILFSRWKHREDRELAIKRDVMLEFLNSSSDYSKQWFNFASEDISTREAVMALARSTIKVRLVTNSETIDSVEKHVAFLASSANRWREIKRRVTSTRKRVSDAQPEKIEAVRKEFDTVFDVALTECDEIHKELSIHANALVFQFRKELKLSHVRRFLKVRDVDSDNIITEIKKYRESGFRVV